MLTISMSFGDSWFAGTQVGNNMKTRRRHNRDTQNIAATLHIQKRTYKAPAPTYTSWGPTWQCPRRKAAREAAPGGRLNPGVARPHGGANWPELWQEDHPYPPEGGAQCFLINFSGKRPPCAIKGASLTPHNTTHFGEKKKGRVHL